MIDSSSELDKIRMQYTHHRDMIHAEIPKKNLIDEVSFIPDFRTAFDLFDEDGSHAINRNELGNVMKRLGLSSTEEELRDLMNEHDQDGSSNILFPKICCLFSSVNASPDQSNEYAFSGCTCTILSERACQAIGKLTRFFWFIYLFCFIISSTSIEQIYNDEKI